MTMLSHCGAIARKYDNDRFLCSLFAPQEEREGLFSLLAFNYEIARIAEDVTEPMAGLIRLQWWRDAIEGVYAGKVHRHEVIKPLAQLITDRSLSYTCFETLMNAREEDIYAVLPEGVDALLAYCKQSAAPLFTLMLEAVGVKDEAQHMAAQNLGIAWALTGIMRSMKFSATRRLMLPSTLLAEKGIKPEEIIAGRRLEETREIVKTLTQITADYLAQAKAIRYEKPATPVFLLSVYVEIYLKRIRKAGYNLFSSDLEGRHFLTQLRLVIGSI